MLRKKIICFLLLNLLTAHPKQKIDLKKIVNIVKSAARYLSIKDVKWEKLYEELKNKDAKKRLPVSAIAIVVSIVLAN